MTPLELCELRQLQVLSLPSGFAASPSPRCPRGRGRRGVGAIARCSALGRDRRRRLLRRRPRGSQTGRQQWPVHSKTELAGQTIAPYVECTCLPPLRGAAEPREAARGRAPAFSVAARSGSARNARAAPSAGARSGARRHAGAPNRSAGTKGNSGRQPSRRASGAKHSSNSRRGPRSAPRWLTRMISPPALHARTNSSSVASGCGTAVMTNCATTTSKSAVGQRDRAASITASASTLASLCSATRSAALRNIGSDRSTPTVRFTRAIVRQRNAGADADVEDAAARRPAERVRRPRSPPRGPARTPCRTRHRRPAPSARRRAPRPPCRCPPPCCAYDSSLDRVRVRRADQPRIRGHAPRAPPHPPPPHS